VVAANAAEPMTLKRITKIIQGRWKCDGFARCITSNVIAK
jgi:hypothetical protein